MRTLNIKPRDEKKNIGFLILILALCILPIFKNLFEIEPQGWAAHTTDTYSPSIVPEAVVAYKPFERPERIKPSTLKIQGVFEAVGSPIAHEVPYVYSEAEKRGLNPELVLAVMAKESGWGKNCYKGNCFGYGATDSGNIEKWFPNDFKMATEMILDSYAQYYKVSTAEEMASRGYNFYPEWVEGVNIIMAYWK